MSNSSLNIDYSLLNPLFKIPITRVLFCDSIVNINSKGAKQKRILIVANFGIFLVKQTKFPKSLTVTNYLSMADVKYVLLDSESAIISDLPSNPEKFNLVSPKRVVEFTSIIFSISNAIFGVNGCCFNCTSEIKPIFDASNFLYECTNPLAERFVSFILHYNKLSKQLNPIKHLNSTLDIINEHIEMLQKVTNTFTFNADLVASNFVSSLSDSLAADSEINELKLSGLNYSSFFPHFFPFLEQNTSLTTLILENVAFSGQSKKGVPSKMAFKANSIQFLRCKLTTPDIVNFLELMKKDDKNITNVSFVKCSFTKDVLLYFFQVLSSIENLDTLRIEGSSLSDDKGHNINHNNNQPDSTDAVICQIEDSLIQLFVKSKCKNNIRHLSLSNNHLNLAKILPELTRHSLTRLNVSGNMFVDLAKSTSNDNNVFLFKTIDEIYFNNCEFSDNSFKQLCDSLQDVSQTVTTILHFDSIKIVSNNGENPFSLLDNLYIPSLISLTWNENVMNDAQTESFCHLIRKNNQLNELELSGSSCNIDKLAQVFTQESQIHRLIMNANPYNNPNNNNNLNNSSGNIKVSSTNIIFFGPKLVNILEPLKNLRYLDVSFQRLGDASIDLFYRFIELGLEELYFDGQEIESIEIYARFLSEVAISDLIKSKWPENDVQLIIGKISIGKRSEVRNQFDKIKKEFLLNFDERVALSRQNSRIRFAPSAIQNSVAAAAGIDQHAGKLPRSNNVTNGPSPTGKKLPLQLPVMVSTSSPMFDLQEAQNRLFEELSFREENIRGLINECLYSNDNNGDKDTEDVLVRKYKLINGNMSISK